MVNQPTSGGTGGEPSPPKAHGFGPKLQVGSTIFALVGQPNLKMAPAILEQRMAQRGVKQSCPGFQAPKCTTFTSAQSKPASNRKFTSIIYLRELFGNPIGAPISRIQEAQSTEPLQTACTVCGARSKGLKAANSSGQ